jgi:predicted  nucleic acid-binding Zn-ribbon protein
MIELYCTRCREIFAEADAIDGDACPYCMNNSLFEREVKDEALDEMPPKLKAEIETDMENAKRYAKVWDHFFDKIIGAK